MSVLSQIIREARENKGDLAVLWLDLAQSYRHHFEKIACTGENKKFATGLFRSAGDEIQSRVCRQFCDKVAKAGSWDTNRMYDIRQSLLSSNEPPGTL